MSKSTQKNAARLAELHRLKKKAEKYADKLLKLLQKACLPKPFRTTRKGR